jgi:hypothetical protein
VEGQGNDVMACAFLRSATSLLPLVGSGINLEIVDPASTQFQILSLRLVGAELLGRGAVLIARLPLRAGATGSWSVSWTVAGCALTRRELKIVSAEEFLDSLYVAGGWHWPAAFNPGAGSADLPLEPGLSGTTCLYLHLASRESGLAALCPVETRFQYKSRARIVETEERTVLVTDVPVPCVPVPIDHDDLRDLSVLELFSEGRFVGSVTWDPTPSASFTSEGGFVALGARSWTSFDELKLEERLGRLLAVSD